MFQVKKENFSWPLKDSITFAKKWSTTKFIGDALNTLRRFGAMHEFTPSPKILYERQHTTTRRIIQNEKSTMLPNNLVFFLELIYDKLDLRNKIVQN